MNSVDKLQEYRDTLDNILNYVKKLQAEENMSNISKTTKGTDTEKVEPLVYKPIFIPIPKYEPKQKCNKCNADRLIAIPSNDIYETFKTCECFGYDVTYIVYSGSVDKVVKVDGKITYLIKDPVDSSQHIVVKDSDIKMFFEEEDLSLTSPPAYYYEADAKQYCQRRNDK